MPKKKEEAVLLIGIKPTMKYVLFAYKTLDKEDKIIVKSRGRYIYRAVDVVQVLTRTYLKDLKVSDIKIGTQEVTDRKTNKPRNVSTIEIVLSK